jgi:two-component system chemotaxis sensor kinase CheA
MKKTSLLPFSTLFSLLPRMIRDLSRETGKEVELEMTGNDVEIDKRILEGLKDPLIHLIRNAVDHGIETPDRREKSQKSPWGTIRLSVTQPESNKVEIELSDDGCGMDIPAIKQKAVETGCISAPMAEMLTDTEALSLIWVSGISTSRMITEISGRGLGMAIVQEHVENLNGIISITTDPGRGSMFKIELPVSLATFRGIIVRAAGHDYILPIAHVEHTLRIRPEDIKTAGNKSIIIMDGQAVSLVNLSDVLGLSQTQPPAVTGKQKDHVTLPAVVLGSGKKRIVCIVDRIGSEQDVLVKSLGKQLRRIPNISGATILGNGKVVPILNVNDIITASAGKSIPAVMAEAIESFKHKVKKSVLIVEDSFTSRTLLKNILEASGYLITTAIDGEDGYNQVVNQTFDAVISDVEMPKMNGFELTRKIREQETLSDLPVILVTSLDSREDKEKGMDAGADAYIVKSSFDQSNLLEVLARLI